MNDPLDSKLYARLSRAAASLEAAADRYAHEAIGRRSIGAGKQQMGRVRLLGAMAAASVVLLVGTVVISNRQAEPTGRDDDVAAGASVVIAPSGETIAPQLPVTTAIRAFDPPRSFPVTTFVPESVVDLGWPSAPTEIVFPAGSTAIELRTWSTNASSSAGSGLVTTHDVGSAHGSGTFRAQANQLISVSGQFAATITISLLGTTTNDPVAAVFTLPGVGSARLPATGRYSIVVATPVTEPSTMVLWIK